tara:strand:+ start:193 stop:591 length:399 start_codon:yes stop_codon:yes gene_type:complete
MTQFIDQSLHKIVEELYASDFAEDNVDLDIQQLGELNYTVGTKLRMKFVDTFEDTDVTEWREIAVKNGATGICVRVNTSAGSIDLNIEYKRTTSSSSTKQWLLRSTSLAVAAWSWYQLHALVPDRYPLLIGW